MIYDLFCVECDAQAPSRGYKEEEMMRTIVDYSNSCIIGEKSFKVLQYSKLLLKWH